MFTLNCKGRLLTLNAPAVMGIINMTPDSFFSESRPFNLHAALLKAEQMIKEGATFIDIGGQSTRPGSDQISEDEELKRVITITELIKKEFPDIYLSIDTFYSKVAEETVNAGADIVNDISSGSMDENMVPVVAALKVPYIAMHMQGKPKTMQDHPEYDNVTRNVLDYFIKLTEKLRLSGILDIIIDPGFGFGKTIEQNFTLLKELSVFKLLQKPILSGISRKSMIWKTLVIKSDEALNGTTALNTISLMNGADILRVHDVKEARETIQLFEKYSS
jgi:dihydropteroate synthase